MVFFNTGLVRNLGHINVFLELWAQLFKENLGTRRLAIKLEGSQLASRVPLFLLGHFQTYKCEVADFCIELENSLVYQSGSQPVGDRAFCSQPQSYLKKEVTISLKIF